MQSNTSKSDAYGDLDELLALFDATAEMVDVGSGYAELMARIASPEYRRRCGLISH